MSGEPTTSHVAYRAVLLAAGLLLLPATPAADLGDAEEEPLRPAS